MKRIVIIVFGIFILTGLYGQQNDRLNIDTLNWELKHANDDLERVNTLRGISEYYRNSDPDTALVLAQQSLDLARNIRSELGEIGALFTMGKIFVSIGNYAKALELYLQSLHISERIDRTDWVSINYNYIGELYGLQEDYENALKYYLLAVPIAEKDRSYSTLGTSYYQISRIFESKGQLDSAKTYGLKSYATLQLSKDPYLVAKILNTLGSVSDKLGDRPNAMEYYRKGIPFAKDGKDNMAISIAHLGIANIFQSKGQMDSSLFYARSSLDIARKSGFLKQVMDASNFLSTYYKLKGQYDSALSYKEVYVAVKDSIVGQDKIAGFQRISFEDQLKRKEIEQDHIKYRNTIRIYILLAGVLGLIVLALVLWRSTRIKQKANLLLNSQKIEIDGQKAKIEASYKELKAAQAQLIQSEKMASLGELTAGVAHEIQNPLNFVNNFSELNNELILELKTEIENGNIAGVKAIAEDISENEQKINHHGKRADAIVKGMLQHSRKSSGQKELTDINELADEYLRLSYHGLRAKDKSFNARMKTDFDPSVGKISIVRQDIGRVILNLINNAFYSVGEKQKEEGEGLPDSHGDGQAGYEPTVSVNTSKIGDKIEIKISDNGNGVPQKILDKIFQPFFTTKPTGQGTGLGLSLSYDIIKGHGGELKVDTKEGEFASFTIILTA